VDKEHVGFPYLGHRIILFSRPFPEQRKARENHRIFCVEMSHGTKRSTKQNAKINRRTATNNNIIVKLPPLIAYRC
jgi:hypothetical protein